MAEIKRDDDQDVRSRMLEAARALELLLAREGPGVEETAAMWRQLLDDPALPQVLRDGSSERERTWFVDDGHIVLNLTSPPAPVVSRPLPALTGGEPSPTGPPEPVPAPPPTPVPRRNLGVPQPPTRFVGRERELRKLRTLVDEQRLVTVSGAGGSGKSRLVAEFVQRLSSGDQPAFLVDLGPVQDEELVPSEVAAALGRQEGGLNEFGASATQAEVSTLDHLKAALRAERVLLVLDNCEQVAPACATLVESLLATCPQLKVLCTSQRLLDVEGEQVYRLPALSLPPRDATPDPDGIRSSEAVELFLLRARTRRPDLAGTPDELRAIADICRGVGGMPFAIELAAAQAGVLSLEQIRDRLTDQLRWRGQGGSNRIARHATMDAALRSCHAQLLPAQRALLRRLAVFRGGFDLAAAEEVGADDGSEVLELLKALVDASLVETDQAGERARYRLLETTRLFGLARLEEAGETRTARTRHRAWSLSLAEAATVRLHAHDQPGWLDRLDRERENFRVALEFDDPGPAHERLRLVNALAQFWIVRGHLSEAEVHLERALRGDRSPCAERAMTLAIAADFALTRGQMHDARERAGEALALAEELRDDRARSYALRTLGVQAYQREPSETARRLLLDSHALADRAARPSAGGIAEIYLGELEETLGDLVEARTWYARAEATMRTAGHRWGLAWALLALGELDLHENAFSAAEARLHEARQIAEEIRSRHLVVLVQLALGNAAYRSDDQEGAAQRYEAAMQAMDRLDEETSVALGRAAMAKVAVARGDLDAAGRWLKILDVERPSIRGPARAQIRRSRGRYLAARGRLTEAEAEHRAALAVWRDLHDHRRQLEELESLALLAGRAAEWDHAAWLYGATVAGRERLGVAAPPVYRYELAALAVDLETGGFLDELEPVTSAIDETVEAVLSRRF